MSGTVLMIATCSSILQLPWQFYQQHLLGHQLSVQPPLTLPKILPLAKVVANNFWLMRLPHCDTFGSLHITINSNSKFDDGKWDGQVGIYKGIDGNHVLVCISSNAPLLLVPYWYLDWTCPSQKWQMVHCLETGKFSGVWYLLFEYGEVQSKVTVFHGGNKGKSFHDIPMHLLTAAS
ncbi:hypothetical protein P691DRAFT_785734 [Macrolepiota fuliginosa MF-IS2]|uniref:Uncharacterized protein n=1 Tax=Macrolepiota fuliginosa MF-IS2 TaxID=1400762 RepID=A0A9P5WW08_9AGAR|nr:hypothetical protein P691DRAFT_785734 [Macrolepiota fuliginosa MF-IS2]